MGIGEEMFYDWSSTAEVVGETATVGHKIRTEKKDKDCKRNEESRQEYKKMRCKVKSEVGKAKQQAVSC